MSQFDWGVMDPNSKSGPQLALDLNDFRDALNTLHRGATRPPYAQPGMLWVKEVSSSRWDLVMYDGSVDLVQRSFNPTTSEVLKLPTSEIDGLDESLSKAVQKDASTATGAAIIPSGSTAQRPAAPAAGMLRFNNSLLEFERYQAGRWLALNILDKALNEAPLTTMPAASTVDIGAAQSNTINISGAVAITSLGSVASGVSRRLVFQGAPVITHNSTSLILPGAANIATEVGDVAEFVSLGDGNWKCVGYTKSSGPTPPLKEYVSSELTITAGGSSTLTHGLGAKPKMVRASLICKTAEAGWAIGDEVGVEVVVANGNTYNFSYGCNASSVRVVCGSSGCAVNNASGTLVTVNAANWRLIVRAWA